MCDYAFPGERERESFVKFKEAGAERYLLRHETANDAHYRQLHPANLSLTHRKQCLWQLKELGFQTGAGFMVGSPGQTVDTLIDDLQFFERPAAGNGGHRALHSPS